MKKILTITALLLIVSMAFFSCDNREFEGNPATLPAFDVSDGAAIGARIEAIGFYGAAAGVSVNASTGTVTFNMASGTDNHGFRVNLPSNVLMYGSVDVTFEVATFGSPSGNAKIGFKKVVGSDMTPYADYEIHFGTPTVVGTSKTINIPTSMLSTTSFIFSHNQIGRAHV